MSNFSLTHLRRRFNVSHSTAKEMKEMLNLKSKKELLKFKIDENLMRIIKKKIFLMSTKKREVQ